MRKFYKLVSENKRPMREAKKCKRTSKRSNRRTVTEEKYQGWTNYETWLLALHIDNDRGMYEYVKEMVEEVCEDESDEYNRIDEVIERLKEMVEEYNPIANKSDFYSDLINAGIRAIDFYEISKHYIDEYEINK